MTAATSTPGARESFIDVDVHEQMAHIRELLPYLADPFRHWLVFGKAPDQPMARYLFPVSPTLDEALDEKASKPGSAPVCVTSFEALRTQIMERFEPRFVVLNGRFDPSTFRMQPEAAVALASAYNDWLIENWLSHDKRILGSVHIAAQDVESCVREIDRVGVHPQMVQVMLPLDTWRWAELPYQPIFEAAARHQLRVALHPVGGVTEPSMGYAPSLYEWQTTFPQNHMSQVSSLIFHGIFDKFPEMKVICLESGLTWVKSLMGRMDHNYQSLRQEVPWIRKLPSEYVRDHCVFGSHPFDLPSGEELVRVLDAFEGQEMLMFASNYPSFDWDSPLEAVPADIQADLRERVLWRNALAFYGLGA